MTWLLLVGCWVGWEHTSDCAIGCNRRGKKLEMAISASPAAPEMAVRFALTLDVSADELLHPKAAKKSTKKPGLKVMRRMEQIEQLPPAAQIAVLRTIDAFVRSAER